MTFLDQELISCRYSSCSSCSRWLDKLLQKAYKAPSVQNGSGWDFAEKFFIIFKYKYATIDGVRFDLAP